jgi:hypothetical protein
LAELVLRHPKSSQEKKSHTAILAEKILHEKWAKYMMANQKCKRRKKSRTKREH